MARFGRGNAGTSVRSLRGVVVFVLAAGALLGWQLVRYWEGAAVTGVPGGVVLEVGDGRGAGAGGHASAEAAPRPWLCSHKLADGPGRSGPVTLLDFKHRLGSLAPYVACLDLDVSEVADFPTGEAGRDGGSDLIRDVVVGHPRDVQDAIRDGRVAWGTAVHLREALLLLKEAMAERRRRTRGADGQDDLCLTLELKGRLGADEGVMREIGNVLRDEQGRALCVAVLGVPVGSLGKAEQAGLGLALSIRDDEGCAGAGRDAGRAAGAFGAEFGVLMPSLACARRADVRERIGEWRKARKGAGGDVRVWTVDSCEEAREVRGLGMGGEGKGGGGVAVVTNDVKGMAGGGVGGGCWG
jgi:hypothetical protein